MPELFLEGPDAERLLSHLGINSSATFVPGRAKQYIGVNHDGRVIGESVLHCLGDGRFELISGMHLQDWVHFNAETGGHDVAVTRDLHTAQNPKGPEGRTNFRFGMDGRTRRRSSGTSSKARRRTSRSSAPRRSGSPASK